MFRKPPSPSPGPGWVALKEAPSTDSSGEEDEIDDDNDRRAHQQATASQPFRKRKESDPLESLSKRPKHEQHQRLGESIGGTSASTATRPKPISQSSAGVFVAGPSRVSNVTSTSSNSVSAGPRPFSSMLPPPIPTKASINNLKPKYSLSQPTAASNVSVKSAKASGPLSASQNLVNAASSSSLSPFKKKDFPSSLDSKLFDRARRSPTKAGSSLGRSVSAREPTKGKALSIKPRSVKNEFIDLSGLDYPRLSVKDASAVVNMSDEDNPPPKSMVARKSIGGQKAQKPPPSNAEVEVIEISSDTDEEPPPKSRPSSQSFNPQPSSSKPASQKLAPATPLNKQTTVPASRNSSGSDKMNVDAPSVSVASKPQPGSNTKGVEKRVENGVPPQNMDVDRTQPSRPPSRQAASGDSHNLNSSPAVKSSIPPKHRRGLSRLQIGDDTVTNPKHLSSQGMQVDDTNPSQSTSTTRSQAPKSPDQSGTTKPNPFIRPRANTINQTDASTSKPPLPPVSNHVRTLSDSTKRNEPTTSTQKPSAPSRDTEVDKPTTSAISTPNRHPVSKPTQPPSNILKTPTSSSSTKPVAKPIPSTRESSSESSTIIVRPKVLKAVQQPTSPIKKPGISSSSKSIAKPFLSRQESKTDSNTTIPGKPAKFDRSQVAVKSAGGVRPKERKGSFSSPFSDSSGDSDSDSDGDAPSASEPAPGASSNDGQNSDKPASLGSAKKIVRTPERTVSVKKQAITPKLSKISASTSAHSSKTQLTPGRQAPTVSKAVVASGSKPITSAFRYRGDTVGSAIDLTSDIEDDDLRLEPIKAASQKLVDKLFKWKGKGRAVSSSHQPPKPYSQTPRSGTDELLLKPSEEEPSPLPGSSSPPLISPVTPATEFPETADGAGQSNADRSCHSAPVMLESEIASTPPGQQVSKTTSPSNVDPKTVSPLRPYVKPVSVGSKPGPSIHPVLSTTEQTASAQVPDATLPAVVGTNQAASNSLSTSTNEHAKSSPAASRIPSPSFIVPASSTIPLASTSVSRPTQAQVSTEDNLPDNNDELPGISSDVEMQDPQTSENESMQETEVRQALMEDDRSVFDSSSERETEEASAIEEAESSTEADSNDTPSSLARAIRRMSRRSSRSSGPVDSDLAERDSGPVTRYTTPDDATPLVPTVNKTLGGLPAITWKEYRQNLDNFIPKCLRSENLPHSLQDQINFMSEHMQKMAALRDVFEAMILENTIENEPEAPPIRVINDLDDEPAPPWEFHYTNEMWHGKDVPPPDMESLISCSCKGACSPKSKTCACLKRQREQSGESNISEFAYDKFGRLRTPDYPIFECNDLCGCGDECRNRVVQHGRTVQVVIKKTKHKGWGIFAGNKKIPSGTFIGIYSGELLLDEEAHDRGKFYNKSGKTYLFDLDFYHLKKEYENKDGEEWTNKYTVDAYQAGNFTRFFNHSCSPNCSLQPCYINEGNLDKPLLVFFSHKDIEPHEEICFDYSGGDDDDKQAETEESTEAKNDDKIYAKCMCGAPNCKGTMFKQ